MQRLENWQGYTVSSGLVTLGGSTEVPLLYLNNPSTNFALKLFLKRVLNITSGHLALFTLYRNPTLSGAGTAKTPVPLRANANAPATIATAASSPSASANGTLQGYLNGGNTPFESQEPLILDPGNSLLVTVKAASSDIVLCDLSWFES
jgi:hypothetical protein